MKKPFLYKRLSKYKTKKLLIDCSFFDIKDAKEILKKRQYVECSEYWIKGFVKVFFLDYSILIQLDINKKNGSRCFYERSIFNEILMYYEKMNE